MKNIKIILGVSLLILSNQLSAATVGWDSSINNVNLNDTFTLNVVGSGFTSNVDGGGLNFSFDSSVLNVTSISIDESVWDLGAGISTGAIDNTQGSVSGISVNAWSDVSGNFTIASITFQAVGNGSTALSLSDYLLNPWASGGGLINPDYAASSVTVSAVPVPAALWLFGSGLLGLAGVAKRKL